MYSKNILESASKEKLNQIHAFSEDYKDFLSTCKTERECVAYCKKIALELGYKDLDELFKNHTKLQPGDKVFHINRKKNIALYRIGRKDLLEGIKILGAHIDSPRLDLKQNPLYEKNNFALLDTHYYGGIKKYQWVTIPLALHGVFAKKDGTVVDFVLGEDENDPIVGISDLLIHLAQDQLKKPAGNVIEGENLDVTIGSTPLKGKETDAVKAFILNLLKEKYDIEEEDFVSSEIEVVPAGKARDYGLDRSMVAGYGHDDRVCAYTSFRALLDIEDPEYTTCCILVDKEEIGSVGATGAQSKFFEDSIAQLLLLTGHESYFDLRRCMTKSMMLSSDVSAAFDPLFPEVNEPKNACYFNHGIVFNKYTGSRGKSGSNDTSAEFFAKVRNIMDTNDVYYQTAELGRVDQGGGGTIAYILGNYNMDVVDAGVAVFNMHSPMEIASKADIYEAYLGYKAFLK